MKLTDTRFWKFEAMMLLCAFLLLCQTVVLLMCNGAEFDACSGGVLILLLPILCLFFAISGIPAWLLYKGDSWLKLAGWLYLVSAVLLIVPLLIFLFDWSPITATMRPDNIPTDKGLLSTDNAFIIIICMAWAVSLILPVMITSYLTKRWIVKNAKALKLENPESIINVRNDD